MTSRRRIEGAFVVEGSGVRGHAYDADDLSRRLVVELVLDGWAVDLARADDFSPEAATIGDGCYGYGFRLPDAVLDDEHTVEIRVANTGETVGGVVKGAPAAPVVPPTCPGAVSWAGGLRLTGWVEPPISGGVASVRCVVERRTVAEMAARSFVALRQGALRPMKARFDLRLPDALADGRVHSVTVLDADGRELDGSPCAVLAFADGLRDALMEKGALVGGDPRADFIERFLTRSVPFGDVEAWLARYPASGMPQMPVDSTVAVILLGDDPSDTLASLDEQEHPSWIALSAPEGDGPGTFVPAAVLAGLGAEAGIEVVVVAPAGARFRRRALGSLGGLARMQGGVVYADASLGGPDGPLPLLWPAFDPERQREQGYAALAFVAPLAAVSDALRRGASSCFTLFDRLSAAVVPHHLPEVLIELPRPDPRLGGTLAAANGNGAGRGTSVAAPDRETGLPSVRFRRARPPGASAVAVIQIEPRLPDLSSVARLSPGVEERLVVSHRPLAVPVGWHNLVVGGGRNPSRLRDAALRSVRSRRVLLLDAGVEPEDDDALPELESRLADGAGAAGGALLDEDGLVVSVGLVLGPAFSAVPAFAGSDPTAGSHAGALRVARTCGALDPAALLIDCGAARAGGGFDAILFAGALGAVDLCLRLRAGGHRLVVSPHARFVRRQSWRGRGDDRAGDTELARLRRRWGEDLADDPFYHPGLNFDATPFSALAWPPRPRSPRRPRPPKLPLADSEAT